MTPIAAFLSRVISTVLTSPARRNAKRRRAQIWRAVRRSEAAVHYFHQVDDPYSHLAVQTLDRLAARYRIRLVPHLVPPPNDAAAPERQRLTDYARRDAARAARRYGLEYSQADGAPEQARVVAACEALAPHLVAADFASQALRIGTALWRGDGIPGDGGNQAAVRALIEGGLLRETLGHYLGAMFYFDGEWYWGVDRLHHLEKRLTAERLVRNAALPPVAPFQDMQLDGAAKPGVTPLIEFWFSFRSPYSWIAAPRVHRLARHYGVVMRWRFILPMVMRGLPVPRIKSRYIMFDTKREAECAGLPFGTAVDPVGKGAERALAVQHRAVALGKGAEFAESGMKAAFADGIDLASERGMLRAAKRAGLTAADVKAALADDSWRAVAEDNRQALFAAGLWGAPTYRVNGGPAHWGQDRLWALEEDLKAAIAAS